MNKENKRFVLSDGSTINSKGFRIDINGLDISRFATNPIMLYEHNPEKVIGRWLDVKKESQKLTAIPEFDTEDTEALHISGKVERGFLKGASIGIIVRDMDIINGVDMVTQSELFEASIVSVPADSGAVRLYNEKMECLSIDKLKLSINNQKQKQMNYEDLYRQICEALGLDPETDAQSVQKVIGSLTKTAKEKEIEEALNTGVLTVSEHHLYLKMLKNGQYEILSVVSDKKEEYQRKLNNDLLDLYNDNHMKIGTYLGADGWKKIKQLVHNGFSLDTVKNIVNTLPESMSLSAMVKRGGVAHDLDWYRKNDPKVLQENPELYQSLLREYKKQK